MAHDLHPSGKARPRTTVPKPRSTAPTPRHVRPNATGYPVRQAVASYLLARTDYSESTRQEVGYILHALAVYAEAHAWPTLNALTVDRVRAWLMTLTTTVSERTHPVPVSACPARSTVLRRSSGEIVIDGDRRKPEADGTARDVTVHRTRAQ